MESFEWKIFSMPAEAMLVIAKFILTHYCMLFAFYTHWKHQKIIDFLFLGGMKREQYAVMG